MGATDAVCVRSREHCRRQAHSSQGRQFAAQRSSMSVWYTSHLLADMRFLALSRVPCALCCPKQCFGINGHARSIHMTDCAELVQPEAGAGDEKPPQCRKLEADARSVPSALMHLMVNGREMPSVFQQGSTCGVVLTSETASDGKKSHFPCTIKEAGASPFQANIEGTVPIRIDVEGKPQCAHVRSRPLHVWDAFWRPLATRSLDSV